MRRRLKKIVLRKINGLQRKQIILNLSLFISCIIIVISLIIYSYQTRVYAYCVAEVGTEILPEDFLKDTEKNATFAKNSPDIDIFIPGDYSVKIKSAIFTYDCVVTIQDTVPPEADVQNVYIEPGDMVTPEDFITEIRDMTEVTATFVEEPDYSIHGTQPVSILLTDLGGNTNVYEAALITRTTKYEITLEAGSAMPDLSEFLLSKDENAAFVTPVSEMDTSEIGDYNIEISSEGTSYNTVLHIVDTISPELKLRDIDTYTFSLPAMDNFIVSVKDATNVTCDYVTKPDFTRLGTQEITIRATDEGGNYAQQTASLTLRQDTEPPVISGAINIKAYIGEKINYKKGVTVSDACDKNVTLAVDSSLVNINAEGDYPVTYTAKDSSGNISTQTITVSVRPRVYTEAEVYALADEVLGKIIKKNMTQREKVTAIYTWEQKNIRFISVSETSDWKKAAFKGFSEHKGDCFVFASVSKALLTRAGITNKDINRIPDGFRHYWNLVDIGEGWYHFDACPRWNHPNLCYIDDASLMAYSANNKGSHDYDKTVYTNIK